MEAITEAIMESGRAPAEDRAAQVERTAATFGAIAKTFRVLSDHDGTAQLIAFGLLYETGLRAMRRELSESGREHVLERYGLTPEELEREVKRRADQVHEHSTEAEDTA
jgi:hypothetical protein